MRLGAQVRELKTFYTKIGYGYGCEIDSTQPTQFWFLSELGTLKLKGVYVRVSKIIRWMFKTMRKSSRSRTRLCNGFFGDWYYNAYGGGKGR